MAGKGGGRCLTRTSGLLLRELLYEANGIEGEIDGLLLCVAENDLAEERRDGVVEMNDRLLGTSQRSDGLLNEVSTSRSDNLSVNRLVSALKCSKRIQIYLKRHVIGNFVVLDEISAKLEV